MLDQQHQRDSLEVSLQSQADLLDYLQPHRTLDDESDEETDEEVPEPPIQEVIPPVPIVPTTVVKPPPVPVSGNRYIIAETQAKYEKLKVEAKQYEDRYKTVDRARKRLLESKVKDIMNKLRKDNFDVLLKELFDFLNGAEQKVAGQATHISGDEGTIATCEGHLRPPLCLERLACLSSLATGVLAQLLGGDFTDTKTEIFLPLISRVSEHAKHKEFVTIFLHRLHDKCPYTLPMYPERVDGMDENDYRRAMGYIKKQDGADNALESETEFLNRMNGLVRLFCKLLTSGGPPYDAQYQLAWKWLSDVLNLEPRKDITALLIRVFLDEAGEVMKTTYKRQFLKLIEFIRVRCLPAIGKCTAPDEMCRLQGELEKFPTPS